MSDKLFDVCGMGAPSRMRSAIHAVLSLFPAIALVCALGAQAQVGGRGPDPIPAFTISSFVYPNNLSTTVTFDPALSYLPSPPPDQSYQYTLIWDFGDGSALVTVGPATSGAALLTQTHSYPTFTPVVSPAPPIISQTFTVTLRIDVTVINQNNVSSPGPSAKTMGQVRTAQVDYPPTWSLTNNSSPATGQLPYQLNVDCSASFDEDGYVIWAAINWGDGSSDLLATLPPSNVAITSLHSYTAPGEYTVTLSLIDNGRMNTGTLLDPTPPASDPVAALETIRQRQQKLIDTGVMDASFNFPKYLPILRQDFLQVQVPGNLMVVKGKFALDFSSTGNDSFDCTFYLNGSVNSVSNAQVSVFLGSGAGAQILTQFTTDLKGNYFNSAQKLKFSIQPKKHYMRFQIGSAMLQTAFQISSATVVNGFADIPVKVVITSGATTSALASTLRFVYNAKAGVKGIGKNPRSTLVGN